MTRRKANITEKGADRCPLYPQLSIFVLFIRFTKKHRILHSVMLYFMKIHYYHKVEGYTLLPERKEMFKWLLHTE